MAFARASILGRAAGFARASRTSVARPLLWRNAVARRGYATGHDHASAKAGSDLPWAIGAVAVTVPTCWYLWPSPQDAAHGHHDSSHNEPHDEAKDEPEEELKNNTDNEEKTADSEGKTDDSSDDEGPTADTPETSDDEGVTKQNIPDAKGAEKRISSNKAIKQDEADANSEENAPKEKSEDKPKASKAPGDETTQSGKQEGLSNTDTKHSVDVQNDPDISKKGEGSPETAKLKGTVEPERPAK